MRKFKIEMEVVLENGIDPKFLEKTIEQEFMNDLAGEHVSRFEILDWSDWTPPPPKVKRTFKVGERVRVPIYGVHIIAQVDAGRVSLISLENGNRLTADKPVVRVHSITEEEMGRIYDGNVDDLEKVE